MRSGSIVAAASKADRGNSDITKTNIVYNLHQNVSE